MTATAGQSAGSVALVRGLIRTSRPKQWVKNILVVVAPAAANALHRDSVIGNTVLVFVVFCLAASSVYLLNDAMRVSAQRRNGC